jgi:hypothetical protein
MGGEQQSEMIERLGLRRKQRQKAPIKRCRFIEAAGLMSGHRGGEQGLEISRGHAAA